MFKQDWDRVDVSNANDKDNGVADRSRIFHQVSVTDQTIDDGIFHRESVMKVTIVSYEGGGATVLLAHSSSTSEDGVLSNGSHDSLGISLSVLEEVCKRARQLQDECVQRVEQI
jgi:hypothetical protein